MKSKSRTTIEASPLESSSSSQRIPISRRLPGERPPTHPGEMLLEEFLKPLGITQSAFAIRLGVSFPRLNELTRGRRAMTPDTALRLARVLGVSADFWMELQLDWDLWHALHGRGLEEILRLERFEPAIPREVRERARNRESPRALSPAGGTQERFRAPRHRRRTAD